jgi:hypothetical protein
VGCPDWEVWFQVGTIDIVIARDAKGAFGRHDTTREHFFQELLRSIVIFFFPRKGYVTG